MKIPGWLTIPTAITLVRLALVPVFLVLQFTEHPGWALAVFAIASLSDALDGFLARVLDQRSKLGAFLDPVADKLLLFAALVTLVVAGKLRLWLVLLMAFRDGLMVIGTLVVRRKGLELPASPSRIGKYATFALVLLVVLSMISQSATSPRFEAYLAVVGFLAALCVLVSTIQYLARFGYLFFAPSVRPRKGGSADAPRP